MFPFFGGLFGGLDFTLLLTDRLIHDVASNGDSAAVARLYIRSTGDLVEDRVNSGGEASFTNQWIHDDALGFVDNLYQFRYTQVSASVGPLGNISFPGAAGDWQDITGTQKIFSAAETLPAGGGIEITESVFDLDIREKANNANIVTARFTLRAEADNT